MRLPVIRQTFYFGDVIIALPRQAMHHIIVRLGGRIKHIVGKNGEITIPPVKLKDHDPERKIL
jgi:hypothetical protein